jgi:hypothetical protein
LIVCYDAVTALTEHFCQIAEILPVRTRGDEFGSASGQDETHSSASRTIGQANLSAHHAAHREATRNLAWTQRLCFGKGRDDYLYSLRPTDPLGSSA